MRLRKSVLPYLNALKLYAIIEGNWIVALYPDDNGYIPVTLHLTDGKWIDDINTDFAKSSPADSMLNYLQQFYKKKMESCQQQNKEPNMKTPLRLSCGCTKNTTSERSIHKYVSIGKRIFQARSLSRVSSIMEIRCNPKASEPLRQ